MSKLHFANCSPARGAHSNAYQLVEGRWKCLFVDEGQPNNQPHHIILALDLIALKCNSILTKDILLESIQR